MNGKKYKELSKNTMLFTISSIGTKLITFFLVPLYTYVLTTEDYGTADLMSTTVSLLLPILSFNIQDAVLRFSLDEGTDSRAVLSIASKIVAIGSAVMGGVLILLGFSNILNVEWQYLVYLWVSYFSHALYSSFQMYLKSKDRAKIIVIASIASTFVCCILNIALLLWFELGVIGYLIATASASVVSSLVCFFFGGLYKDIDFSISDKELLKKMLLFSAPLIINSLAWWVNSASDRYILTFFQGPSANGIYSISYKMPTILSTLQTIFYNAWSISAIKEFDRDDRDGFIGNIYSLFSCISLVGCSAILIVNPFLAKFLYAKDFYLAWKYVPALLVGTAFNGLSLVQGCLFSAVKRTKDVSVSTIVGAIVNTVLNFVLIYSIGIQGAAIATMVGYIASWLMRSIKLNKCVVKIKIDWFSHVTTLVLIITQGVLASVYGTNMIQLILFVAIVFFQRKAIVNVFRKVADILEGKNYTP